MLSKAPKQARQNRHGRGGTNFSQTPTGHFSSPTSFMMPPLRLMVATGLLLLAECLAERGGKCADKRQGGRRIKEIPSNTDNNKLSQQVFREAEADLT